MAVRGAGNILVTYNSVDITPYLNSAELANTVAELESTNLASTASGYTPGLPSYTLSLGGDFVKASDSVLGVDAMTPARRAVVVKITDEDAAWVQYGWTNTGGYGYGFITGYNISGSAAGKIEHSPSLRLSGSPQRTTSA